MTQAYCVLVNASNARQLHILKYLYYWAATSWTAFPGSLQPLCCPHSCLSAHLHQFSSFLGACQGSAGQETQQRDGDDLASHGSCMTVGCGEVYRRDRDVSSAGVPMRLWCPLYRGNARHRPGCGCRFRFHFWLCGQSASAVSSSLMEQRSLLFQSTCCNNAGNNQPHRFLTGSLCGSRENCGCMLSRPSGACMVHIMHFFRHIICTKA